ncbi:conserved hypothetical protein [Theileria orientalis strain Shintoku]|uniref:Protein transport protein SEC20 n=1 Tax=Theileria orientalis strain Shintoku TaxID=869250 RepID=J4CD59_THEOR|nr:conserved hypothetical protein [Theileria orientalis strain Shintoku]BAM40572.1 conserved hypothetical protein [Theileria orientalis strain Shintoku]|eukprot:XP_009690873.1 conserved hypothetical protein [Theileria orientalis strain Shintoku]
MNSYKSGLSNVFNEKNKKLSEESLIDNLIHELKQLDSNLEELFHISNADLTTHYSIHKFRLKASRRISSYSNLLRNLVKSYESTTSTQQYVKLFTIHQFYNERLMRHKNKLSEWWSRNERRYHALCLSSFVSQISQPDGQTTTSLPTPSALGRDDMLKVSSKDDRLMRKLKDTRNMMINQINQMDAAESSLLKSAIKRYGMVRSCYFLFLFSCGFIVLRRFRFFKIFYLGFKVIKYPIKYLSGKSKPVKDVNSELAEL